jgi:hypothetical protein
MFALWPLGRYGDILGQNYRILLKIHRILKKKMYIHFISTSILNPSQFSYTKYHILLFVMPQTWCVYFIANFGTKTADF